MKKYSLSDSVQKRSSRLLELEVALAQDVIGKDAVERAEALQAGEVHCLKICVLVRLKQNNDEEFAKALADMAEVYINDAFGVCHRAHASVEAIAWHF